MLQETGVAAWELPKAAMRQMHAHSHAEAQLCGLDAGLAILESAAGSWLCPPGRCVWIPPGMLHSLRSCGKISGWIFHLRTEASDGLPAEPRVLALSPLLEQVVQRIAEWIGKPALNAAKGRLVDVLKDEITGASQMQILRSLELLAEGQSVLMTALEVGYESPGAFIRTFRNVVGVTPAAYTRGQAHFESKAARR